MDMTHFNQDDYGVSLVRPYLLTKGRTRSTGVPVVMESLIERGAVDRATYERLDRASRSIYDLLTSRLSAAEISAKLRLPLGVVFVLVGDMGGVGVLTVHKAIDGGDENIIRRLIAGVSAL